MRIKRIMVCLVMALFMVSTLAGCAEKNPSEVSAKKLSIVTTIFPIYDWTENLLGDNPAGADVTMLLDSGVDLHSYQPTAQDMIKISECDMFVYVGGESDEWVGDALKEAVNKNMVVVNLLDVLGDAVKAEEVVEGMQGEDEHDHDHDKADHDHDHEEEEEEKDEHVWLSLRNASAICEVLEESLERIDGAHADTYKKNLESYKEKLASLDGEYKKAVGDRSTDTLLFGDRFPFRYLVDDYDLNYYAAFVGCSAETEASFETITFLAGKVDELSLKCILTIENNDQKIAKTISDNTKDKNQKILTLDSMQSVTAKDVKAGATYLSIMEQNLSVLKEALK
ncbi:MAG: zinc ABC transporter substrate-binding protein [Lachnospiraceae bacterium]|nr:zinc ABC transporter substrate-binding protein [Lachnospiraceae bacterium]